MSENILHFMPASMAGDAAAGYPPDFPWSVREQQQGKELPEGWVECAREDFDAYKAKFADFLRTLPPPPEDEKHPEETAKEATIADLEAGRGEAEERIARLEAELARLIKER